MLADHNLRCFAPFAVQSTPFGDARGGEPRSTRWGEDTIADHNLRCFAPFAVSVNAVSRCARW
jgi:hypothetical protein